MRSMPRRWPEVVEVDVARHLDRVAQVDPAVAALLVAVERRGRRTSAWPGQKTRASGSTRPAASAPYARKGLKTEPGEYVFWIARFCSGRSRVLEQARPLRRRDAAREPVRVVGGRGDEREDLAGLRVQRDDASRPCPGSTPRRCPAARGRASGRGSGPGSPRGGLLGDLAAVRVDDDAPLAVDAREQPLVGALDALLPDPVADAVDVAGALDLLGRRLREVAERVRRRRRRACRGAAARP